MLNENRTPFFRGQKNDQKSLFSKIFQKFLKTFCTRKNQNRTSAASVQNKKWNYFRPEYGTYFWLFRNRTESKIFRSWQKVPEKVPLGKNLKKSKIFDFRKLSKISKKCAKICKNFQKFLKFHEKSWKSRKNREKSRFSWFLKSFFREKSLYRGSIGDPQIWCFLWNHYIGAAPGPRRDPSYRESTSLPSTVPTVVFRDFLIWTHVQFFTVRRWGGFGAAEGLTGPPRTVHLDWDNG